MKNIIIVCLLAAVACTYSLQASAKSLGNNLNLPIKDSIVSLYNFEDSSHELVPLELKTIPIPNQGVKLAAVCSINDPTCTGIGFGYNDNDIDLDSDKQCQEEGYNLTSCPNGQNPENICPFDSKYFKSCKCPNEYKYSQANCNSSYPNSTLGESQCFINDIAISNACVCNTTIYPYTASTCNDKEELSGTTCKASTNITYASACTCIGGNDKYKHTDETCKSSHPGFANWTINNDICQSKASDCVCTPNTSDCSSYTLDTDTCSGGSKIGESCNNGCQLKWKCKDLCPNMGTLTSCPNGNICTYEECSKKYYISGCAIGYTNWCAQPVTDCNTLGYNSTLSKCEEGALIYKCPFDATKIFCKQNNIDCSSMAVTPPANATCNGSSTLCPTTCTSWECNEGYVRNGNTCSLDAASACTSKGYSKSTYCYDSRGEKTLTCDEDLSYKKCLFDCPTYKNYITSQQTTLSDRAKNSFAAVCGNNAKLCNSKIVWPTEFCIDAIASLNNIRDDYSTKCGKNIPLVRILCPNTHCKDGRLGVEMCGSGIR